MRSKRTKPKETLLPPGTTLELMIDNSRESSEAVRLLRESGLPFRTVYMSGFDLPALRLGDSTYPMLSGVKGLVWALLKTEPDAQTT